MTEKSYYGSQSYVRSNPTGYVQLVSGVGVFNITAEESARQRAKMDSDRKKFRRNAAIATAVFVGGGIAASASAPAVSAGTSTAVSSAESGGFLAGAKSFIATAGAVVGTATGIKGLFSKPGLSNDVPIFSFNKKSPGRVDSSVYDSAISDVSTPIIIAVALLIFFLIVKR